MQNGIAPAGAVARLLFEQVQRVNEIKKASEDKDVHDIQSFAFLLRSVNILDKLVGIIPSPLSCIIRLQNALDNAKILLVEVCASFPFLISQFASPNFAQAKSREEVLESTTLEGGFVRTLISGSNFDRIPPAAWFDILQFTSRDDTMSQSKSSMELVRLSQVRTYWAHITRTLQRTMVVSENNYSRIAGLPLLRLSGDESRKIVTVTLRPVRNHLANGTLSIQPLLQPLANLVGTSLVRLNMSNSGMVISTDGAFMILDTFFIHAPLLRVISLFNIDFGENEGLLTRGIIAGLAVLEQLEVVYPRGNLSILLNLLPSLKCLKLKQGLDINPQYPMPSLDRVSLPSSLLSLDIAGFSLDLNRLVKMESLRVLKIKKDLFTAQDIESIYPIYSLKEVKLTGKLSKEAVSTLETMKRLSLFLSLTRDDENTEFALVKLGRMITSLELSTMNAEIISSIPALCPNLRSLSLSGSHGVLMSFMEQFEKESHYVGGLSRLESFYVNGRRIELV
jgi:hypothetical protein